jgi:uncharacterized protein YjgD (DUF1641 family)
MANPLTFKPNPVDPHHELGRRLDAAPVEHAEALLALYDTLQAAHDKGILDAVHGMISARDAIAGQLAKFAKAPEGEAGIRNLLQSARLLASVEPEMLERLTNALTDASVQHQRERTPPTLWEMFKRASSEDGRRGLSFFTHILTSLGRSLKK